MRTAILLEEAKDALTKEKNMENRKAHIIEHIKSNLAAGGAAAALSLESELSNCL